MKLSLFCGYCKGPLIEISNIPLVSPDFINLCHINEAVQEDVAQRQFEPDEILLWDHLGGPDKKYLLGHIEKAIEKVKAIEN